MVEACMASCLGDSIGQRQAIAVKSCKGRQQRSTPAGIAGAQWGPLAKQDGELRAHLEAEQRRSSQRPSRGSFRRSTLRAVIRLPGRMPADIGAKAIIGRIWSPSGQDLTRTRPISQRHLRSTGRAHTEYSDLRTRDAVGSASRAGRAVCATVSELSPAGLGSALSFRSSL